MTFMGGEGLIPYPLFCQPVIASHNWPYVYSRWMAFEMGALGNQKLTVRHLLKYESAHVGEAVTEDRK